MSEDVALEEDDHPSEATIDVVRTARVTSARWVFFRNLHRIEELLRAGLFGIDEAKERVGSLRGKIEDALQNPSEEVESTPKIRRLEGGLLEVNFTESEMKLVQEAIVLQSTLVGDLHYHLHNILCVAAWGAFEGYIQGQLAEIFSSDPKLLASDKKVTVAEVIGAGKNLSEFLITRELDDVGRKSFSDLQKYLSSKLSIQFSNDHANLMQDIYFLRNVVAHAAGFLRNDQLERVPLGVDVHHGELRLSREYLEGAIKCLKEAVDQFHELISARLQSSPVSGLLAEATAPAEAS